VPSVAEFWVDAQRAVPGLAGPYALRRLGRNAEINERLIAVILAGEKTGTFNLPWMHGIEPGTAPLENALMIYTDFNDQPRALVRQSKPEFVPYDEITAAHTACEGKAARDLDTWRKIHWPYWTTMLAEHGLKPTMDMPVCVERFTLLYPRK
jgi:uncharacterized protein YhfF